VVLGSDGRPGLGYFQAVPRTIRAVRQSAPDVIQGWMYHANLAALVASFFVRPRPPVIWNVRHALHDREAEKRVTVAAIRSGALLSSRATRVVYNSRVSAGQHQAIGYDSRRTLVIPNGFDCEEFAPNPGAYTGLRRELGLAADLRIIGLIGRYHPLKGHRNFLVAAALLSKGREDVHFVLAGRGVESGNDELMALVRAGNLESRVSLLGQRADVPRLCAALDVATCASSSEAFPNILGEAMACGVPCAATDVGDSGWVVGEGGIVVPAEDPHALATAWERLLRLGPEQIARMGQLGRERVLTSFSIDRIVERYEALYQDTMTAFREQR